MKAFNVFNDNLTTIKNHILQSKALVSAKNRGEYKDLILNLETDEITVEPVKLGVNSFDGVTKRQLFNPVFLDSETSFYIGDGVDPLMYIRDEIIRIYWQQAEEEQAIRNAETFANNAPKFDVDEDEEFFDARDI